MKPPSQFDEETYFCWSCMDNLDGWRLLWCTGMGVELVPPRDSKLQVSPCGRRKNHYAHTFAEKCVCFGRNPSVEKRKQRIEQAAKK